MKAESESPGVLLQNVGQAHLRVLRASFMADVASEKSKRNDRQENGGN